MCVCIRVCIHVSTDKSPYFSAHDEWLIMKLCMYVGYHTANNVSHFGGDPVAQLNFKKLNKINLSFFSFKSIGRWQHSSENPKEHFNVHTKLLSMVSGTNHSSLDRHFFGTMIKTIKHIGHKTSISVGRLDAAQNVQLSRRET